MQQTDHATERTTYEEMEEADRRNGEPEALHDRPAAEPPPAGSPEHDHLERRPAGDEMPSDTDVQAERQAEGERAERLHE